MYYFAIVFFSFFRFKFSQPPSATLMITITAIMRCNHGGAVCSTSRKQIAQHFSISHYPQILISLCAYCKKTPLRRSRASETPKKTAINSWHTSGSSPSGPLSCGTCFSRDDLFNPLDQNAPKLLVCSEVQSSKKLCAKPR